MLGTSGGGVFSRMSHSHVATNLSSDIEMEMADKGGSSTRTSSSHSQQSGSSRRSRPDSDDEQTSTSPEMPSSSRVSKPSKACRVCGDKAKSFHFGGLSCDSCKAFFRRSVQHDGFMNFQCSYENSCNINMSTRKSCQKCRFQKCIAIGMEKSWVMNDEERAALNRQRLERRAEGTVEVQVEKAGDESGGAEMPAPEIGDYTPDVTKMLDYMSLEEQDCIKEVVEYYRNSYDKISYRVPESTDGPRNSLQIVDMFTTILRRFAYFSKLVPEFRDLSRDDQGNLLRASVLEMCLLRGALSFDSQNHRWPNTNLEMLKHCPQLKVEDMEKLVSRELYELHMNFIHGMQKMKVDEPTVMLLLLVVLFYPERSVVQDVDKVNEAQEKYLALLEKYVAWRYGSTKGHKLYPQLLIKLTDLRQLNDLHTEYNLKLDKSEVEIIRKGLGELQLNPYPQWNIVQVKGNGSETLETVGSPEFPPQPVESQSPPVPTNPRRSNPMAEAFLRRIPALIDDPMAPLMGPSEMQEAKARFEAMMASRESQSSGQNETEFQGQSDTSSQPSHFPTPSPQIQPGFDGFPGISDQMNPKQPGGFENIGFNPQSDFFRQVGMNLSPEMRAQLGALVGNRYESMSIPSGLDLSKISPEMISSFLGGMGQQGQRGDAGGEPESGGNVGGSSGGQYQSQGGQGTGRMPSSEDYPWN